MVRCCEDDVGSSDVLIQVKSVWINPTAFNAMAARGEIRCRKRNEGETNYK